MTFKSALQRKAVMARICYTKRNTILNSNILSKDKIIEELNRNHWNIVWDYGLSKSNKKDDEVTVMELGISELHKEPISVLWNTLQTERKKRKLSKYR